MIILDSDVVIDFLRQHSPAIEWLISLEDSEIGLPGYVVMELIQGCRNKKELEKITKLTTNFEVIWPSHTSCDEALNIFVQYRLSHNLGLIDALIGQTAVAQGVPLYTFNRKHYAVIPNLTTIQPYER